MRLVAGFFIKRLGRVVVREIYSCPVMRSVNTCKAAIRDQLHFGLQPMLRIAQF